MGPESRSVHALWYAGTSFHTRTNGPGKQKGVVLRDVPTGVYFLSCLALNPACRQRCSISRTAALEGAHTSTCPRRSPKLWGGIWSAVTPAMARVGGGFVGRCGWPRELVGMYCSWCWVLQTKVLFCNAAVVAADAQSAASKQHQQQQYGSISQAECIILGKVGAFH
jgi:hypothetical protein